MKNSNLKDGHESNKNIKRFIYFIAILFFIYIFRLAYLQIFDVNMYRQKGDKLIKTKEIVYQDRGTIYDRNKKPLASNLQFNTAYISQAITKNEKERLKAEEKLIDKSDRSKVDLLDKYEMRISLPEYTFDEIEKVASILEVDERDILDMLEKGQSGPIAYKIDDQKKREVEDLNLGYISFYNQSERHYPGKEIAASTIGFVENNSGMYGLEKQYDNLLSGKNGYAEFYKARGGTKLAFESSKKIEGEKAKSIVTTLDERVQKVVYDNLVELFKDNKPSYATAIVTDPNTGEVLAMESLPSFDANEPRSLDGDIDKMHLEYLDEEDIDEYIVSRWNNFNVSAIYEPGSTFKTITTAIALDSTREVEDHSYVCTGSVEIAPGVRIGCWRAYDPHGSQSLKEAFSNSCNPAYVGILDDIGREKFVSYGNNFKYGQKSGIDLPNEVAGSFPTDTDISNVDFRPMSYGHSISTTTIQQISALNATVNGGIYYRPHLLKEVLDDNGKTIKTIKPEAVTRVISEEASEVIREYLENNSHDAYGFKDDTLRIGHKSGTTVVKKTDNIFDTDKTDDIGMNIISNYAMYPSDKPKYSLLVLAAHSLEYDFGSNLSVFINNVFTEMEKLDLNTKSANITEKELVKIPDLSGMSIAQARDSLVRLGLDLDYDPKTIKDYNIIVDQSPVADGYIEAGANIKISKVDNEKIEIPDFVGMSVEEASTILKEMQLKFEIKGQEGKIEKQTPKAFSIINKKEKIQLISK